MHLHYYWSVALPGGTMAAMLTSKITARAQTTLPSGVRKVLGLETGEELGYIIEGNSVRLVNASILDRDDPALSAFLEFLARDLKEHPEHVTAFPPSLLQRATAVAADVDIDHDSDIEGAVAINGSTRE